MIFDRNQPIGVEPTSRARNATQTASCTLCGARLDCTLAPLRSQRYPGEVVIRCTGCGVRETPAMRAAWEERQRITRDALQFLPCKRCNTRFRAKAHPGGARKEFCSDRCRMEHGNDKKRRLYAEAKARRRALEAAQKAKRRERAA